MTLGQILIELRKEKRVCLREVGKAVGISVAYVSIAENGRGRPSVVIIEKLAGYYNTTVYEIFCEIAGGREPELVFNALLKYVSTPNEYSNKQWVKQKIKRLYVRKAS